MQYINDWYDLSFCSVPVAWRLIISIRFIQHSPLDVTIFHSVITLYSWLYVWTTVSFTSVSYDKNLSRSLQYTCKISHSACWFLFAWIGIAVPTPTTVLWSYHVHLKKEMTLSLTSGEGSVSRNGLSSVVPGSNSSWSSVLLFSSNRAWQAVRTTCQIWWLYVESWSSLGFRYAHVNHHLPLIRIFLFHGMNHEGTSNTRNSIDFMTEFDCMTSIVPSSLW
jgi:hypothetical protein